LIRSNGDAVFKSENSDYAWCLKHNSSETNFVPSKSFEYLIAKSDAYFLIYHLIDDIGNGPLKIQNQKILLP